MTTKAQRAEAERVEQAFHIAMMLEGAQMSAEALKLWQDYPRAPNAQATVSWLAKVVALVMGRRRKTKALARSYYRLVRALRTGKTIPALEDDGATETTLSELRQDFREQLPPRAARVLSPVRQEPAQSDSEPPEDDDGEDRILIEEIERLKQEEERLEREAERELREDLANLGPGVLDKKLNEIDLDQPASTVDKLRDEAHAKAGARQAAVAARVTMNGARHDIFDVAKADKRALGWIRISRTGTPCGWCAMLISRGIVLYTSRALAEGKSAKAPSVQRGEAEEGSQFHDNDNCYAQPVFSEEDYETNPRFALNREYAEAWPRVTKGLSGKAAVSAWRRYIRQTQKPAAPVAA